MPTNLNVTTTYPKYCLCTVFSSPILRFALVLIMGTYWFVYVTIGLVALIQIPIGIDLLRFFFPQWKLTRLASRSVYALLFIVMGLIYIVGISYHLFVYLPLLVGTGPLLSVKGVGHTVFALWVWLNVVGNYYYSVTLHPGLDKDFKRPTKKPKPKLCIISENGTITEVKEDGSGSTNRPTAPGERLIYCDPSQITSNKPTRGDLWEPSQSQYCKICDCAVLNLDHHCPFTGNCVGKRNFFNFYMGLCYGTLGLLYAVLITLPYFLECNFKNIMWFFGIVSSREKLAVCAELGPHTHIFLPVCAGFFLSLNMVMLQSLFLISDLSTYNVLLNWSKYPMIRFLYHRIKARKFQEKNSRANTLLFNRSKLGFIFPMSVKT